MWTLYTDNEVTVRELIVKQWQQSGKNRTLVEIFKGVLVVANLPKTHSASTYVSTENDKSGFAHKTFWSDLFSLNKVEETELEWNDFENDLHVASDDPSAAREILTPDFMLDLHDWWLEHKLNMRIAFRGDKMYMLLPESSVRISSTTLSKKPDNIKKYAWSIVRPIWRSLMLLEDIT